jgi:hypothetical protein
MGTLYRNRPGNSDELRRRADQVEADIRRYPSEQRNNIESLANCLSHTMDLLADALDRISELERKE